MSYNLKFCGIIASLRLYKNLGLHIGTKFAELRIFRASVDRLHKKLAGQRQASHSAEAQANHYHVEMLPTYLAEE